MTQRSTRLARTRDYALTVGGGATLALGLAFLAARIWFHNYFILTNRPDPLGVALVLLGISLVLGILHALAPPPLAGGVPGSV